MSKNRQQTAASLLGSGGKAASAVASRLAKRFRLGRTKVKPPAGFTSGATKGEDGKYRIGGKGGAS